MKYYRFPENRITKMAFGVFLFAMLMLCRDTLVTSSIIGFYKATFISYGIIALVGVAFLWVHRKNLKQIITDERILLALAATVVFLVPMLVKQDWQLLYFSILICIYFAIFLSYFVSVEEVAKYYVLIISLIGAYSCIATYLLDGLAETEVLNFPVFSNGVHEYYNFGLSFSAIDHPQAYRNWGIFREPGIYQYFLILAIVLNNYSVRWNREWKRWSINFVLAIAMFSTFATGGWIEMALLAAVVFIDKKWYQNKKIRILTVIVVALLVAFVIYSFSKQNSFYNRLYNTFIKLFNLSATSSGGVRFQSILFDIGIFFKNPLVGEKLATVMYPSTVQYNTTSTMILYAGYGIVAGCFHVISWIALLWDKNRKAWVNLALLLIMFMSFNTQDLTADMFLWLFPIMAMVEKGIPFVKSLSLKRKV